MHAADICSLNHYTYFTYHFPFDHFPVLVHPISEHSALYNPHLSDKSIWLYFVAI